MFPTEGISIISIHVRIPQEACYDTDDYSHCVCLSEGIDCVSLSSNVVNKKNINDKEI